MVDLISFCFSLYKYLNASAFWSMFYSISFSLISKIFNNSWSLFNFSLMNAFFLSLNSVLKALSLSASSSLYSLFICWSVAVKLSSFFFNSSSKCVSPPKLLLELFISSLISFSRESNSALQLSYSSALLFPLSSALTRVGDASSMVGESTGCSV